MRISWILLPVLVIAGTMSCARPADREKKEKEKEKQRHVHKELKPDVHPVPDGVARALPGLQNDNIYIYREVAPLIGLVAYEKDYSRTSAIKKAARAFEAMLSDPDLQKGIEFWIIQVQPAKETKEEEKEGKSRVVVWGVRPSEVKEYRESKDLPGFVRTSEYMLVDDEIIEKGDERLDMFSGLKPQAPSPSPSPPGKKPEHGDTASELE